MNTLEQTPEITVLLPKKAFKEGSRNNLTSLLADAGYNDAAQGKMGRFDQVTNQAGFYENERDVDLQSGEITFRFVKDIGRLATQMRLMQLAGKPAITVTGGDSLLEAYLRVTQQVQGVVIEKVADLGIGKCTLEWQTPEEQAANKIEELSGRELFSKYPELMRFLLKETNTDALTFESEGADTNINDFREEGLLNTGALEIVGSGQTSIDLKLKRLNPDDELSPLKDVRFSNISTDVFVINPQNISRKTRMAAMTVCDALESARPRGAYTSLKVNLKKERLEQIRALKIGLIGPSIQEVLSNVSGEWADVTLMVPDEEANGIQTQIKLILGNEAPSPKALVEFEVVAMPKIRKPYNISTHKIRP